MEEIIDEMLKAVEELPKKERKKFLKKLMPVLMQQDLHDIYSDYVNENKYPTFTMLALTDKEHGDFFQEQLGDYLNTEQCVAMGR